MGRDAKTPNGRRPEAWAAASAEGEELNRRRARAMGPGERIAEGLALVRIAGKLQAGRRDGASASTDARP